MFTNKHRYLRWMLPLFAMIFIGACGNQSGHMGAQRIPSSFKSNGERIYFTGISERSDTPVVRAGGSSMPMMGNSCASCHGADRQGGIRMMPYFWVKSPPLLAEALFGEAPSVERVAVEIIAVEPITVETTPNDPHEQADKHGEHARYDDASLREAIINGRDPSGASLKRQMPRWRMSEHNMQDLIAYLRS